MKLTIAVILIIHGLITAAQSGGSFASTASGGIQNPSWMSWWPTNLGRSWLLSWLGLEKAPFTWISGVLWLAGGIALAAAGLGSWVLSFQRTGGALWPLLAQPSRSSC